MNMEDMAKKAKSASIGLAAAGTSEKNSALMAVAEAIYARSGEIIAANMQDLDDSKRNNLAEPLMKRLKFDEKKIHDVIDGIHSLIKLPDPSGITLDATELDSGLELFRVSCPIGVMGVIFESRPDALVQISTLCLKSGNALLLKGGSEAMNTNRILAEIITAASESAGMPGGWIQLLETRSEVSEMLKMDRYIDLIIPRGSNEFVRYIMDNSNIAVMGHADGICHVYIDAEADPDMAEAICVDSKCQYVAVCNAVETLLVHEDVAGTFLPRIKEALERLDVDIYGCDRTAAIINVKPAAKDQWKTEYLDYAISVRVVSGPDQAIDHINTWGSGHTDSIVTGNRETASRFISLVDSGNVFWNCSTRFSDGFRYGLGAEVGISTGKIHARGPVGLEGLVIYKYIIMGGGQVVKDYADGSRSFTHKKLDKKIGL